MWGLKVNFAPRRVDSGSVGVSVASLRIKFVSLGVDFGPLTIKIWDLRVGFGSLKSILAATFYFWQSIIYL